MATISTDHSDPDGVSLHLVRVCRTPDRAHDLGLTLLAAGLAYWVMPDPGGFALMVETSDIGSIRHLLSEPSGRREPDPPRLESILNGPRSGPIAIFWTLVASISLLANMAAPEIALRGALAADAVLREGEWWRPVTALTLHADIGHLAANLVAGVWVTLALAQRTGGANAILATLSAGTLGNILATLIRHQSPVLSVGASTAVFGALGVLCALPGLLRHLGRNRMSWIPLATGMVILGIYGSGDIQTDVLAHLTGFAAGWLTGRAIPLPGKTSGAKTTTNEVSRTILACMIPLLAWLWALWP